MTHLILDIETTPDASVATVAPDAFPPVPAHRVVTIGCLLLEDGLPRRLGIMAGDDEAGILRATVAYLERAKPTVVTWNGRGFDMPVIAARSMRHGIAMPGWYGSRDNRYRFSVEGHFDLKDFVADFGAAPASKLDAYARLVGFPGKVGTDGSMVAEMVAAGRQTEVDDYCLCDVVQTAAVFMRVEFLRGAWDAVEYRARAKALVELVDGDGRLAPLRAGIDRGRFLMTEAA